MFKKLTLLSIAIVLGAMATTSSAEGRPRPGPPENNGNPVPGRVHAPDDDRGGRQDEPRDRPNVNGHDDPRGPRDSGQRDEPRNRPDLNGQDGPRGPRGGGQHDDRRGPSFSGHGGYKDFPHGGDGPRGSPAVGGPPGQRGNQAVGGPPDQRGNPTMGGPPRPHNDLAPGAPPKGHHNRHGRGNDDGGSFDQRPRPQRPGNLRNLSVHYIKTN